MIANNAYGDGTHLHSGDSFTPPSGQAEVLFVPTAAPWLKIAESIDHPARGADPPGGAVRTRPTGPLPAARHLESAADDSAGARPGDATTLWPRPGRAYHPGAGWLMTRKLADQIRWADRLMQTVPAAGVLRRGAVLLDVAIRASAVTLVTHNSSFAPTLTPPNWQLRAPLWLLAWCPRQDSNLRHTV